MLRSLIKVTHITKGPYIPVSRGRRLAANHQIVECLLGPSRRHLSAEFAHPSRLKVHRPPESGSVL